ncbi:MAG TPA: ATP-binding protein, partial [Acidimicrobiales bacterium]
VDQLRDRLRQTEHGLSQARREAERFRRALDAGDRAVVIADREGAVVYRNLTANALVDARHGDALAARVVEEALAEARASGHGAVRTLELHGPPPRTLVVTTSSLGAGGEALGTVAMIEDVTQRKQLEAVRRDFVANVSHELRTPVGAVGLLAETMVGETDPAVLRRLSQRITVESERVAQIINELLDLSRMEAGGLEALEPVAIGPVITAAVDRVRPVAEVAGVTIEGPGADDGAQVMGHRAQLVSAISNLVDNAVKYSDAGTTVSVTVTVGDWIDVAVGDTGIGIPARELDRIFERFYRVDRARSRATGGTGLGLSIVRHTAQNHGGEVLVTSREGEGSVFTLRLPRSGPAGSGPAEAGA